MNIEELNNGVAVEITDFDIRDIDVSTGNKIANLLKDRVIVVLKNQSKASGHFANFVNHIGLIGNWINFVFDPISGKETRNYIFNKSKGFIDPLSWKNPNTYPVQRVSGEKIQGYRTGIFGTGILDWHANLNSLECEDGVALQGYKECSGTSTVFLNTAIAYRDMPEDLLQRCENVYCEYTYAPEKWAKGLPEAQLKGMKNAIGSNGNYKMWLIQENANENIGIYFYTNNNCKIITQDDKLYDDLYSYLFQEKHMYENFYEPGDIVLSDQLLSLHKRVQDNPEILAKRVLHRITFRLSNLKENMHIKLSNSDLN